MPPTDTPDRSACNRAGASTDPRWESVLSVAAGKLYALVHPFELNGRIASHPLDVRGFSTVNCYLLVERDRAVMLGTGYSIHQDAILTQLDELLGGRRLSLAISRLEFVSLCNARPIADRLRVEACYQRPLENPSRFLNFRPEFPSGETDGLRKVEVRPVQPGIPLDDDGRRMLTFIKPELRLLPGEWAYDDETRTLFTADVFSWVWRDTPSGPWLLSGSQDDPTTFDRVADFLLHNRYWWLAGADTAPLRRALAELFDRLEVAVLAPDHGCVLSGEAVKRHYQLLDDVLARAPGWPSIGVQAGRWRSDERW